MIRLLLLAACAATVYAEAPVDKAWTSLTEGSSDKSKEKRAKAVRSLSLIKGDEKAREMAEKALSDEKPEVRAAGAEALGQMGASASIPKLEAALRDDDVAVVLEAANAMILLGDTRAYDVYYAMLTGERKSGDSLVEAQMKVLKDPKALASMGFEAGLGFIPFAGAGLSAYKMVRKDDESPVRAAAAQRLVKDPDPKSGEALGKFSTDKKWLVRASVLDAIARRGDPALLPAAVAALDDDNDNVRFNACAAVIRLSEIQSKGAASE